MAEFMIIYHFLSTFTRYLFEFDKSLLKGVHFLPESTRFSPVFLNVSKRDGFRLRILLPRNNSSPLCKAGRQTKEEYGFKRGLNQWSVVLLFAFCYCKDEFNTDGALPYVATQPMGK